MIHTHNDTLDANACGVYYIRDNNAIYIGKTTRSFAIRWKEHIEELVNGTHHNYKLQNSYNNGNELVCGVLVTLESHDLIDKAEDILIQYYATRTVMYNLEGVTQTRYQ